MYTFSRTVSLSFITISVCPICPQRRIHRYVYATAVPVININKYFIVPAIIYIDKWGRRPMLLVGTLLMGFFLFLVGGIQGRFGQWGDVDGSCMINPLFLHEYITDLY